MFAIGDIVKIFAPQAGHDKYHLCIFAGDANTASQFIYLNSDPSFAGTYVVDCARVPCLPVSTTGKTAFSFALLPRYSANQLVLYKATKMGELEKQLAADLHSYASTVKTMTTADKKLVLAALASLK